MPDFSIENTHEGIVCGLDEVGRAPLAGPVIAACVYIPVESRMNKLWAQVNDSKLIAKNKRLYLAEEIKKNCVWALAEASAREVEKINIVQASFLAMKRAYEDTKITAQMALIDGHLKAGLPCPMQTIIKGDSKSVSIAAASILAKVHRDKLMEDLSHEYPHYGWERNVGYPTPEHLRAIDEYGLTDHHRKTFAPVKNFLEFGSTKRQLQMAL